MAISKDLKKKILKRAVQLTLPVIAVALVMNAFWFVGSGLQDYGGLIKRLLFTLLVLPVLVFIVAFMNAAGELAKTHGLTKTKK